MRDRLLALVALSSALQLPCAASAESSITFDLEGEARVRLEGIDGQFRANGAGGDHLLAFRTLVKAEAQIDDVALVVELQDSRNYLDDDQSPLSTGLINPLDILQAHLRIDDLPGLLGEGSQSQLQLGRQTVSIGSKRQLERPSFANVIKSYTGAHWTHSNPAGDQLHAVLVVPLDQRPDPRDKLDNNALDADVEQWNRRIWGAHYIKQAAFGTAGAPITGEIFVYGLSEVDTAAVPTPNRHYVWPGFRVSRAPSRGQVNFDFEGAYRFGTRHATSSPLDTTDLDVSATMLFARLGYTFDHDWVPNLALQAYHTSGDADPNDGKYGQFERLFGSRRTDLNNTSIYGPLTPANLNAFGARFEAEPDPAFDLRLTYSAAFLDSATDRWVVARLQDPTGQSGKFIGHALDSRFRYRPGPKGLTIEFGGSALLFGELAKSVPQGPQGSASLYGYSQVSWEF